jgi:hypothetical protein
MKHLPAHGALLFLLTLTVQSAEPLRLTRADYADRAHAAWVAQMAAVYLGFPFEHRTASVEWVKDYPKPYTHSIVDDDWYYEMSALRAFEKHGPGLTIQQLGEQWQKDVCGTWGSSKEARLLMAHGVLPPETGHPRYNRSWWTIGPQFSAEIYGLIAPGRPNLAAQLAREFGRINGHAEAVDGAVFVAGAVSLAFVETDPKAIVREAAKLIHPESPYRRCLDEIIARADAGKSFEEITHDVIDRWAAEYPGTNNAVANGGIIALCLWFGEGDFLKTVNLACRVSDFTDADCIAAGAAAVVGAMHGRKSIPQNLIAPLNDRIFGDKMGDLPLPPVDESISALAQRTAAFGEKMLLARGVQLDGDTLVISREAPQTLPLERFTLADFTQYWQPEWKLERAGFGATIGGLSGYPGGTWLADGVLTTWPRELMRGVVLTRKVTLPAGSPRLIVEVAADAGRAWEFSLYVNNQELHKRPVVGGEKREWQSIEADLSAFAGLEVTLRLYQNLLAANRLRPPSVAHWKSIVIK